MRACMYWVETNLTTRSHAAIGLIRVSEDTLPDTSDEMAPQPPKPRGFGRVWRTLAKPRKCITLQGGRLWKGMHDTSDWAFALHEIMQKARTVHHARETDNLRTNTYASLCAGKVLQKTENVHHARETDNLCIDAYASLRASRVLQKTPKGASRTQDG